MHFLLYGLNIRPKLVGPSKLSRELVGSIRPRNNALHKLHHKRLIGPPSRTRRLLYLRIAFFSENEFFFFAREKCWRSFILFFPSCSRLQELALAQMALRVYRSYRILGISREKLQKKKKNVICLKVVMMSSVLKHSLMRTKAQRRKFRPSKRQKNCYFTFCFFKIGNDCSKKKKKKNGPAAFSFIIVFSFF